MVTQYYSTHIVQVCTHGSAEDCPGAPSGGADGPEAGAEPRLRGSEGDDALFALLKGLESFGPCLG